MAATSIWRVHGWLGKVVTYIENPDKTENPAFYGDRDNPAQELSDVIRYAVNSRKTQTVDDENREVVQRFVTGVNCYPGTAREEMLAVKRRFGKEDGTVAYHGYQSFAPGEATPELAHEIGVRLAKQLWGDRYQVLVATHLDKESHLHNHFIVNTVSFLDGKKYHRTKQDYRQMREVSDALCREYGLSVIEHPEQGRAKSYGEWNAERQGKPVWRDLVRRDIDEAVGQSMTMQQFWKHLQAQGYEVKFGKHVALRPQGKERFVRLGGRLGEHYTPEAIRQRILNHAYPERPLPEPRPKTMRRRVQGNLNRQKKATGFRALYYHYCFLLGYFPRSRGQSNKRLHFLLREDLQKMESIAEQTRLLARHHIDTDQQLLSYKQELERQMEQIADRRGSLRREKRHVSTKEDKQKQSAIEEEIKCCNQSLSALRREVRLCEEIARRSGVLSEKIRRIQRDAKFNRKETKHHEPFRRRSGTGREA